MDGGLRKRWKAQPSDESNTATSWRTWRLQRCSWRQTQLQNPKMVLAVVNSVLTVLPVLVSLNFCSLDVCVKGWILSVSWSLSLALILEIFVWMLQILYSPFRWIMSVWRMWCTRMQWGLWKTQRRWCTSGWPSPTTCFWPTPTTPQTSPAVSIKRALCVDMRVINWDALIPFLFLH